MKGDWIGQVTSCERVRMANSRFGLWCLLMGFVESIRSG
jgi:hypothetical protein